MPLYTTDRLVPPKVVADLPLTCRLPKKPSIGHPAQPRLADHPRKVPHFNTRTNAMYEAAAHWIIDSRLHN
jgi:hypothetical protein